jgi:FkbM family methyltransferase
MLLFPNAVRPNCFNVHARSVPRSGDDRHPVYCARDFSPDAVRAYPSYDITAAVVRPLVEAPNEMPWVVAVGYSSQQQRARGEFLLELRTENSLSEVHLPPSQGQLRLTAGPFFGDPAKIVSAKLYANDLDPDDTITLHHLSMTRQWDPEAIIPGFRYGDEAYRFHDRAALEERANELMAACYERMLTLRQTEHIAGNSSQDAILPFMMEYSHRRFPYIIGNLNGLYWYGLDQNQSLEHLSTDNGMRAGDIVFDCGSHTGHVACAYAAAGGSGTNVICFDPFPQNNYLTDLNRRLTGLNIEVAEAGAGRETKSVLANNGHQIMIQPENVACKEYPLVALDDYYASKPTFLKIDVEGFELEVLLGARKILHDLRPRVFIELHPHLFCMTHASYRKIYEAFPKDAYKFALHHAGGYGDIFENHLDTEPLGNLYAEPIG